LWQAWISLAEINGPDVCLIRPLGRCLLPALDAAADILKLIGEILLLNSLLGSDVKDQEASGSAPN
jgi:hypothetical protein